MRLNGTSRRTGHRREGRVRYMATLGEAVDASPASGLFAVYTPDGPATHVYYCEPASGRCSCGASASPCPHIAAVIAALARPPRGRKVA